MKRAAGDFLKRDAETSLRGSYAAAGLRLDIETNSRAILGAAGRLFPHEPRGSEPCVRLRLWVDAAAGGEGPLAPWFRGSGSLVFSGFSSRSALLLNVDSRRGIGRFSPAIAKDEAFWRRTFFPSLLATAAPAAGLPVVHAACAARDGMGVLLAGPSGSGKSTLSLALAQAGFDFLSDDRTLCALQGGSLRARGLSPEIKIAPAMLAGFGIEDLPERRASWKGSVVSRMDASDIPSIRLAGECEPRWIVFLERTEDREVRIDPVGPQEAAERLARDLHRTGDDAAARCLETVAGLSRLSCWKMRCGLSPAAAVRALKDLLAEAGLPAAAPLPTERRPGRRPSHHPAADPLRRFIDTPYRTTVALMGRPVRIETNSAAVLDQVRSVLPSHLGDSEPGFSWTIAAEPSTPRPRASPEPAPPDTTWPPLAAYSDDTLRFVSFGGTGFIAADLEARRAAGVIRRELAGDTAGFAGVFLAALGYLTAPALGLVPLSAACVALRSEGLLVLGPPDSGKTTASYRASEAGMGFHADQCVFLEFNDGRIRAWGEFWPAAFRPESVAFLPEIAGAVRPLRWAGGRFLCIPKTGGGPRREGVTPRASVFLERGTRRTDLARLDPGEAASLLALQIPHKDNAGPQAARAAIFDCLGRLPAYRLSYGDDPAEAARMFPAILSRHRPAVGGRP